MNRLVKVSLGFILAIEFSAAIVHAKQSFICAEPGGKRLVKIDDDQVWLLSDPEKSKLYIDKNDILTDPHATAFLVVDDDDVRPSSAGVKIATFDGGNIRHGPSAEGKVLINYNHREICPDAQSNRIFSIEGDEPLSKQELVAGLYLLKPEMFKLSEEEIAAQTKAIKEAGEEQDRKDAADQVAGTWTLLNSSGINPKVGAGTIAVAAKKGDAYPVTFDFTKGGGPSWTGAGVYKVVAGDKLFFAAYGTEKTIGLCVYEISGGTLNGTWYPWYIDGTDKNIGTEVLKGPETLDGTYKIDSAKAPFSGAAYSGDVTIKPLQIIGADDDAKPYQIVWNIGGAKIEGVGIRSGKFLFVSSGSGADVNIAKFKIGNGTMNSDWFKLGLTEKGQSAAMSQ